MVQCSGTVAYTVPHPLVWVQHPARSLVLVPAYVRGEEAAAVGAGVKVEVKVEKELQRLAVP